MPARTPAATLRFSYPRRTLLLASVLSVVWVGVVTAQVTTGGAGPKAASGPRAISVELIVVPDPVPGPRSVRTGQSAEPGEAKLAVPRRLDNSLWPPSQMQPAERLSGPELTIPPEPPVFNVGPKSPLPPLPLPPTGGR
ncbi:MAG: hypothetical protein MUF18_14490 [Fimbriiglobus sp.]|nr:hypothetical protein [Fimbriiglobus sp.]